MEFNLYFCAACALMPVLLFGLWIGFEQAIYYKDDDK